MLKHKNIDIRRLIQTDRAFVVPGMIGVLVFILIPLLDVVRRSFVNAGHLGVGNYRIVLLNAAFRLAFRNTIRFELVALPVLFVLSLLAAVAVKNMKNQYITFAFLIPMALPSNSVAIIWKILFDDHGIINGILVNVLHQNAIGFFRGNAVFWLLVVTFLWKNLGYHMLLWLAGLYMFPPEICEAARIDGAGNFVVFTRVVMPNLKGTIFTVCMLSLMNSFKIFREVYLIAGNYPDDSIYLLQHLFNNWFSKLEIGKIAAAACMTAILFFLMLLCLRGIILREDRRRVK